MKCDDKLVDTDFNIVIGNVLKEKRLEKGWSRKRRIYENKKQKISKIYEKKKQKISKIRTRKV